VEVGLEEGQDWPHAPQISPQNTDDSIIAMAKH